jgi:UDP-glucose 4-epimerase
MQSSISPPQTVLVTGAAGFIGSHVARYCAETLHLRVIALDDLSGGFSSNIPSHPLVTFVQGSICDAQWIQTIFDTYPIEIVYHLAAYAAEGLSHFIRSYNYRVNLVGSVELLNAAVRSGRVRCFVFTSSIAVYGAAQTPMLESVTPQPEDPYGISKYAFELDLEAAYRMWGLEYVIFRPHNVYGPHQNLYDKYRNVIGIFMYQLLTNQPLTIFGDGNQTRAFSYIDDVAPVIARGPFVPAARNQVFNVGAEKAYTVNALAQAVGRALGMDQQHVCIEYLPARKEVQHASSDHSKVRRVFELGEPVSLDDGLARMTEWVHAQHHTLVPVEFQAVEVLEGLPPSWHTPGMRQCPRI